jgi:urease accessory protein
MKRLTPTACLAVLTALLPVIAWAHPGHDPGTHPFVSGIAHPLTGLDHVLAMLAIGLWAIQLGRRARWFVPLGFLALMVTGATLPLTAYVEVPFAESAVLASVLVTGLLLAASLPVPLWAAVALTGAFGLFHGYAHGAEMPIGASPVAYVAGFALATATLLAAGSFLGLVLTATRPQLLRASGAAVVLGALLLAFA